MIYNSNHNQWYEPQGKLRTLFRRKRRGIIPNLLVRRSGTRRRIKRISSVLLVLYSAFVFLAIFHIHSVSITSTKNTFVKETESSKKNPDPFLDSQAKCRLVQFANTQFSNPFIIDRLTETPDPEKFNLTAEQIFNLSSTHHSITLRAPPTIS